jgi:hypothetical protein
MKGILAFTGMTIGGAIGWWLGAFVGITTSVMLSSIGSGAGLFAARWLMREYLD